MVNKLKFVCSIIKNKGLIYFLTKYIMGRFITVLYFNPRYIPLRGIEFCLPVEHKHKFTLPEYLQLEPTSRCNMKCRNCTRDTLDTYGDLSRKRFLQVMKQFPFLRKVKLQGLGEPLLNDNLFYMASFLKNKKIGTYIATNGTLITEHVAGEMVKYFDQIEISVDSPDRALFCQIRGKDCLEDVLRGARFLVAANRKCDIAINFVVDKTNIHQLSGIVTLSRDLGIGHINAVTLQDWVNSNSAHKEKKSKIQERMADSRDFNKSLQEAMGLARSFDIYLDFSTQDSRGDGCFWYKKGVYISWNGYVNPCCLRPNYTEFNLGNVFERNIREIWNSREYIELRRDLAMKRNPVICKGCNYIWEKGAS